MAWCLCSVCLGVITSVWESVRLQCQLELVVAYYLIILVILIKRTSHMQITILVLLGHSCNHQLSVTSKLPCTSFKTLLFSMGNNLQIASFQDPCSYAAQNVLLARPFSSPWETLFKLTVSNLHGRLPSGICFFQDHPYTSQFGLLSRPLEDHISYSMKLTHFKTLQRRKSTIVHIRAQF